jgi:hypothetical protein
MKPRPATHAARSPNVTWLHRALETLTTTAPRERERHLIEAGPGAIPIPEQGMFRFSGSNSPRRGDEARPLAATNTRRPTTAEEARSCAGRRLP